MTTTQQEIPVEQQLREIARACLAGAESGGIAFPQIVQTLAAASFDGYLVDFRQGTTTYYPPQGEPIQLATAHGAHPVAGRFDADRIRQAIRDAQQLVAGYTYAGFCQTVTEAGCAGYLVSVPGQRVLYFGRTGEVHTECFPANPS
jgi:uncharacterized protein YbcV (DUF1398 family)